MKLMRDKKIHNNYRIDGVYLNYYKGGNCHTPAHSHKGQHQLVISLTNGCKRDLVISGKTYHMGNGDIAIFGSAVHSVPKSNGTGDRISIATFMVPMT